MPSWFEAREELAPHHEVYSLFGFIGGPHGEVRAQRASNHEGVAVGIDIGVEFSSTATAKDSFGSNMVRARVAF